MNAKFAIDLAILYRTVVDPLKVETGLKKRDFLRTSPFRCVRPILLHMSFNIVLRTKVVDGF